MHIHGFCTITDKSSTQSACTVMTKRWTDSVPYAQDTRSYTMEVDQNMQSARNNLYTTCKSIYNM